MKSLALVIVILALFALVESKSAPACRIYRQRGGAIVKRCGNGRLYGCSFRYARKTGTKVVCCTKLLRTNLRRKLDKPVVASKPKRAAFTCPTGYRVVKTLRGHKRCLMFQCKATVRRIFARICHKQRRTKKLNCVAVALCSPKKKCPKTASRVKLTSCRNYKIAGVFKKICRKVSVCQRGIRPPRRLIRAVRRGVRRL